MDATPATGRHHLSGGALRRPDASITPMHRVPGASEVAASPRARPVLPPSLPASGSRTHDAFPPGRRGEPEALGADEVLARVAFVALVPLGWLLFALLAAGGAP
jgi:hypothetical protein